MKTIIYGSFSASTGRRWWRSRTWKGINAVCLNQCQCGVGRKFVINSVVTLVTTLSLARWVFLYSIAKFNFEGLISAQVATIETIVEKGKLTAFSKIFVTEFASNLKKWKILLKFVSIHRKTHKNNSPLTSFVKFTKWIQYKNWLYYLGMPPRVTKLEKVS